jgi:polysaccharide export outer membrane protein
LKKSSLVSLVLLVLTAALMSSCTSYKNVAYFRNLSDSTYIYKDGAIVQTAAYKDVRIQPNDILSVDIRTIDPEVNTALGSTLVTAEKSVNTEMAAAATGYLVDADGNIELPIAGKIKVGGLTTAEAKEQVRQKALKYYKEPVVNVRIINFKVTVLGEVSRPGMYLINGEKATVLDALSQAGDMTIFGKRSNVLLAREENGRKKMIRFDLNATDMFESPYFYLRQGDMLYVQPNRGKAAANDAALARTYTIVASTLSLLVVLVTRLR